LNRVTRVKVLNRSGVIPQPEGLEHAARCQIGGWTSDQESFEVQVRIHGAHRVQVLKEAPPALPVFDGRREDDGQSMIVTFRAYHEFGPARWTLPFGPGAEALGPESLRKHVATKRVEALGATEGRSFYGVATSLFLLPAFGFLRAPLSFLGVSALSFFFSPRTNDRPALSKGSGGFRTLRGRWRPTPKAVLALFSGGSSW